MENFIFEGYLDDLSLCDALIEHHKNSPKHIGSTGRGIDTSFKDSTDSYLSDRSLGIAYINELQKITNKYIETYPMCNYYAPWQIVEDINIQHYGPNQGYKGWHTERGSANYEKSKRHLVFMTYLNDVTDGGGTEFMHQKLITTARKGKTLIWPADWTYTHRGQVSPTQDKYIITGWYSFIE